MNLHRLCIVYSILLGGFYGYVRERSNKTRAIIHSKKRSSINWMVRKTNIDKYREKTCLVYFTIFRRIFVYSCPDITFEKRIFNMNIVIY